jgi:hypothetical protein
VGAAAEVEFGVPAFEFGAWVRSIVFHAGRDLRYCDCNGGNCERVWYIHERMHGLGGGMRYDDVV